jgi:histidyl-tRNA synthetase
MERITPRTFKGTRDFLPQAMIPREDLLAVIKESFVRYGFAPLQTPAFEYLDVLTGKSGGEADKLIYRLDYKGGRELALHYDLTVPLARVVAQYPNEIVLPFKRYQIQPVWRADRPQLRQGRFREFVQCDVDIVGVAEALADAEIIALTADILGRLGFGGGERRFVILVNDRRLLAELTAQAGLDPGKDLQTVCRCLDKYDKVGGEGVAAEFEREGVPPACAAELLKTFELVNDPGPQAARANLERLAARRNGAGGSALAELERLFSSLAALDVPDDAWAFTPWLARGLDYYTGPIFESVLPARPHIGSLTGGGRYDGLVGRFAKRDLPATGTTIGIDRILAAMEQLEMFDERPSRTQVLVAYFGEETRRESLGLAARLRRLGHNVEVYLETAKLGKQFKYADRLGIPLVALIGPEEAARGLVQVKTLADGEQRELADDDAILSEYLAAQLAKG